MTACFRGFCLLAVLGVGPGLSAQDVPAVPSAAPAAVAAPVAATDLSGYWSGSWSSYTNGHHGPMMASFCRIDANHYEVHFRGRFFKLIPFNYTAVLTVTSVSDDRVLLSGSHRLGPILGTFSYNAWASETQFVAGYCSEKDQGQFSMVRCCR